MTYYFRGNTKDLLAGMLADIREAAETGPASDAYFRRALAGLVGLYDRQAEYGAANPEELESALSNFRESCLALNGRLSIYAQKAIILAEGANDNEWYELCIRRSVLQLLIDNFLGPRIASLINQSEVAELDVELRRVGLEQGPIPADFAPKGLPVTHWWWTYPEEPEVLP